MAFQISDLKPVRPKEQYDLTNTEDFKLKRLMTKIHKIVKEFSGEGHLDLFYSKEVRDKDIDAILSNVNDFEKKKETLYNFLQEGKLITNYTNRFMFVQKWFEN